MKKLALILLSSTPLFAAPILQDSWNINYQIQALSPIGQSFTASDAYISSIGVGVRALNPSSAYGTLTFSLFSGDGFGGSLLGTAIVDPGIGYDGIASADFSGVALTIGQQYTLQVAATNASPYWGMEDYSIDAYSGGSAYLAGGAISGDLRFQVTPGTAPIVVDPGPVAAVPEPSTLALFGLACLSLGVLRRRRIA